MRIYYLILTMIISVIVLIVVFFHYVSFGLHSFYLAPRPNAVD